MKVAMRSQISGGARLEAGVWENVIYKGANGHIGFGWSDTALDGERLSELTRS